jgi:uncharacterized protein YfaS (alpha-2-macroglobulin family)
MDLQGNPVDPAQIKQNQRFIVVLSGEATEPGLHHVVLVDMLPAGWEIEAPIKTDQAPDFLGELTMPRMREARDDRFVAAFDLGEEGDFYSVFAEDIRKQLSTEFKVAYVARAVTPGSFALPEAAIEDMYRPEVMARTAGGTTTVSDGTP